MGNAGSIAIVNLSGDDLKGEAGNKGEIGATGAQGEAGATGPHYYQELYASPHVFDRIYLMNVRVLVSDDGGDNFYQMKEVNKHSDNHSLAFKKDG